MAGIGILAIYQLVPARTTDSHDIPKCPSPVGLPEIDTRTLKLAVFDYR